MLPKIPRIERRARGKITPEYEDSGLFKGGIVQVQLALVPVFGATSRGDCTARAFNAEGTDVTVIFAGRRRPHFQPLYSQLRYMYAQAQQADALRGAKMRDVNSIQLPVQCEGAWRARIERDERGQETRSMQFMVARWGFQGHDGRTLNYGTAARLPKSKRCKDPMFQ
ncbi:hypothetical protein [Phaeobacter sp. B1627]|uniref:hypothetical protein n=1 Tax=Phaeobacter sp. B1627 TaxID=2583809 RepID=UPI00111A88CF|nr:hypothetical protein [Phaeobacter sp. B1627]TNJ43377.1 hypothetical protein FGE21_09880 [Phaeobacter sp. B1627]